VTRKEEERTTPLSGFKGDFGGWERSDKKREMLMKGSGVKKLRQSQKQELCGTTLRIT
jgi:hypothetical protein